MNLKINVMTGFGIILAGIWLGQAIAQPKQLPTKPAPVNSANKSALAVVAMPAVFDLSGMLTKLQDLETKTAKLAQKVKTLQWQYDYQLQDAIIGEVFGKPSYGTPASRDKSLPPKTAVPLKAAIPLKAAVPLAQTVFLPQLGIAKTELAKLEGEIDNLYGQLWSYVSKTKFSDLRNPLWLASLDLTTNFRRFIGDSLCTERSGFQKYPESKECIIKDQLFLKFTSAALNGNFFSAMDAQYRFMRQLPLVSAYQLWTIDEGYYTSFEKTLSRIKDSQTASRFVELAAPLFLNIYDEGKYRWSHMFEWFNQHKDIIKQSYNKNSLWYQLGVFLHRDLDDTMVAFEFDTQGSTESEGEDVGWEDMVVPFQYGKTTPFGIPVDILKKKNCDLLLSTKVAASGKITWNNFVDGMTDPMEIGMGTELFSATAAMGTADVTGLCGGIGNKGGGGGMSCHFGYGGGESNAKECSPLPGGVLKGPSPALSGMDDIGGGKGDATKVFKMATYRADVGCSAGVGAGDVGDSPISVPKTESEKKADQNKETHKDAGKSKVGELNKGTGKTVSDEQQKAAMEKADAAYANALIVPGMQQGSKDGVWTVTDGGGNVVDSGEGPFKDHDPSHAQGLVVPVGDDGDSKIFFDKDAMAADKASAWSGGLTGAQVAAHEWAHSYLLALGADPSAHHGIISGAGLQCGFDQACSSSCSSPEARLGSKFLCKKGMTKSVLSVKCGWHQTDPNCIAPMDPIPFDAGGGVSEGKAKGAKGPSGGSGISSAVKVGGNYCSNLANPNIGPVAMPAGDGTQPLPGLCTVGGSSPCSAGGKAVQFLKGHGWTDPGPFPMWMKEPTLKTQWFMVKPLDGASKAGGSSAMPKNQ